MDVSSGEPLGSGVVSEVVEWNGVKVGGGGGEGGGVRWWWGWCWGLW